MPINNASSTMTLLSAAWVALLAGTSLAGQAQRQAATTPPEVPLHVSLKAGSAQYTFDGPGSCRHAAQAGIYDAPASMWSVQHNGKDRSLTLTMWRPRSGADMMSLVVSADSKSHRVNTVKVGARGEVQGSGKISFEPGGKGGTFSIDATTADGARIAGTVRCEAFTAVMPAGGL